MPTASDLTAVTQAQIDEARALAAQFGVILAIRGSRHLALLIEHVRGMPAHDKEPELSVAGSEPIPKDWTGWRVG